MGIFAEYFVKFYISQITDKIPEKLWIAAYVCNK